MIKIRLRKGYPKQYEELTEEDGELKKLIFKKVRLFEKNPDDSRLRNHALTRKMEGLWAFSITDDIRIVYEWIGKQSVRFLAIGSHKEVYPK